MQASKIEAELEDLKTSHNNILLVFYKFLNDVIKFSPNEISLKDTELLFHNPDMKEMLIKRILLYSADSKQSEYQFVELFLSVFESVEHSKDYKKAIKEAKREFNIKYKDLNYQLESVKKDCEKYINKTFELEDK